MRLVKDVWVCRQRARGRTAFCSDDALAVLFKDRDLLPALDLVAVHRNLGKVLVNKSLDDVSDVIMSESRVGRQADFD